MTDRAADPIADEWAEGEAENLGIEVTDEEVREVQGMAEDLGMGVTDEEVRKAFDEHKRQHFPKEEDFQKFLEDTGETIDDVMSRVRSHMLVDRIREKVIEGTDQVSDEQISSYYEQYEERFEHPERRDLLVVLTETEDRAWEAKSRIQEGEPFADVAMRYSIDDETKSEGGRLPGVDSDQMENVFSDAVFAADVDELAGPVRTPFGWWVFKVTKIQERRQQSLEESKETIRQLLVSENEQKALDDFVKDFREKWKERTERRGGAEPTPAEPTPEGQ